MAKFCTNCGKPLEDGKTCDCKKETNQQASINTSNDLLNNLINTFKNIFKKPFDTIKEEYTKRDLKYALILLLINCIMAGILCYCLINNTLKGVTKQINTTASTINDFADMMSSSNSSFEPVIMQSLPFGRIFIYSMLSVAVFYLTIGLMNKLCISTIFKNKISLSDHYKMLGMASPLLTLGILLSIVLSYLSYKLAFIALALSIVLNIVSVVHSYLKINKIKAETAAYTITLSIASSLVAYFIVMIILMSIFIAQ